MDRTHSSGLVSQVFLRCVEDCFEPIMLTDRKGRMTYVNPAWTLTYGYSKAEAIGNTPRLLRSTQQDENFYRSMWTDILDPRIGFWRGEVVNRAKDGHQVPVLLTITPYREASGEISGYMGIAVDLTDQKRMEQQILRQDRLASIGLLAGGLAHEVGNPLGVIRGRAELAMQQVTGNAAALSSLEIVVTQIDRISQLIQSLLRVSRVPDKVMLRDVPVRGTLEEVLVLLGESLRKQNIQTKLQNIDHVVLGEPSHMQQLFLNLLINSMHAIEERQAKTPGSITGPDFIEISCEVDSGACLIAIRDSGCGITQANIDKLFQPFFTTKSAGKGTGLGLAIVLKLIEEMSGNVSVQSPGPGLGATFTLEFKLAGSRTAQATPQF